jgi:FkbM family methyltransferase
MPKSLSRSEVLSILTAYFIEESFVPETWTLESSRPVTDAKSEWVKRLLERTTVHDQDFLVFGHFRDPASTILDVGANYGYSAASIWASGASSGVISFEPIQGYEKILDRIRQCRRGRFDFVMTALGNQTGSIRLTTPVVNGRGAAALTTAVAIPNLEGLAENIFRHAARFKKEIYSLKFYRFVAPITTLDRALAERRFRVNTDRIVALKIDTEGFEAPVLLGASDVLRVHKPLIMVEGGCYNPVINKTVLPLGYSFAMREGRHLLLSNNFPKGINGFYVHTENAHKYREMGLLQ